MLPPGFPVNFSEDLRNISIETHHNRLDCGTWTVEASKDITFTTGVFTVQTDNVSGSLPFAVTTDPWAPPSAGIWYFRATYSGDANYDASGSPPADEQLIVKSGPHVIPSAATWSVAAVIAVMGVTGFLLIRRMKTS